MDLKKLSLPQRLAAGCGCVAVLAVLSALALFILLGAWQRSNMRRASDRAPAGWADSIRALGRLPDLAGLTPARGEPGDGAGVVHDSALAWRGGSVEDAFGAIVGLRAVVTADDSAAWRRVAADTSLDRFVAAARRQDWRALDRALASEPLARRNLLALPMPRFAPARNAARALVIRAMVRLGRGEVAGARTDLAAATGLGEQMFRHEPTIIGSLVGRAIVSSAMRGWERYADRTRDTALARRATAIREWAARRPGSASSTLMNAPDTALVLARDTSLALGMRSEAFRGVLNSWVFLPRGIVFGPPSDTREALRAMADHPAGGDAATLAGIAAATADRMRFFGIFTLMRESNYGAGR